MRHPVGARALRSALLLLLVLVFLPQDLSAHRGILDLNPAADEQILYLPATYREAVLLPDLVVESIMVNSDSAVVVIKNQGLVQVESTVRFWVDLYVDPERKPEGPNDVWDRMCTQGIVWAIRLDEGDSLEAGETLTMTYCSEQGESDPYYSSEFSHFHGQLDPGTPIAVQVDSANVETTYGGVLEADEVNSTAYNNISTTVSIAGSGCGTVEPEQPERLLPLAQADGLPLRPQHAE